MYETNSISQSDIKKQNPLSTDTSLVSIDEEAINHSHISDTYFTYVAIQNPNYKEHIDHKGNIVSNNEWKAFTVFLQKDGTLNSSPQNAQFNTKEELVEAIKNRNKQVQLKKEQLANQLKQGTLSELINQKSVPSEFTPYFNELNNIYQSHHSTKFESFMDEKINNPRIKEVNFIRDIQSLPEPQKELLIETLKDLQSNAKIEASLYIENIVNQAQTLPEIFEIQNKNIPTYNKEFSPDELEKINQGSFIKDPAKAQTLSTS